MWRGGGTPPNASNQVLWQRLDTDKVSGYATPIQKGTNTNSIDYNGTHNVVASQKVFNILQQCNDVQFANSATLIWTLWKKKKSVGECL